MRQRQFDSKSKEKEQPDEKPTMSSVRAALTQEDQHRLDAIRDGFGIGMFKGKLVVQWCGKCGKWRPQYVSQSNLDKKAAEERARPYFVQDPETFPCVKCARKLMLNTDPEHTILETKNA